MRRCSTLSCLFYFFFFLLRQRLPRAVRQQLSCLTTLLVFPFALVNRAGLGRRTLKRHHRIWHGPAWLFCTHFLALCASASASASVVSALHKVPLSTRPLRLLPTVVQYTIHDSVSRSFKSCARARSFSSSSSSFSSATTDSSTSATYSSSLA